MHEHNGRCHCGAVEVTFETAQTEDLLSIRTCGCSFCRRLRPIYTSDPKGHITVRHKPGALHTYRFGHETADFISCAHCGTYLGAVTDTANGRRAVLNVAGILLENLMCTNAPIIDFDEEDEAMRTKRRTQNWTPVTVEVLT